jgi:two-component system phosphate regulon sensor histidine kinase PhoR
MRANSQLGHHVLSSFQSIGRARQADGLRVGSTYGARTYEESAAMVQTELAEVLRHRRDELLAAWAERVHQTSAKYGERPVDEIRDNLRALLDSILTLLEDGDPVPLERQLDKTTTIRANMGFGLEDILAVIFSGIQEGVTALKEECDSEDRLADCFPMVNQLTDVFSRITLLHAKAFEDIRRKEYAARTISDLARTCESMDQESILEKAVTSIRDSFPINVVVIMPGEAEEMFFSRCDDDAGLEEDLGQACETAIQNDEAVRSEHPGTRAQIIAIPVGPRGGIRGAMAFSPIAGASLSQHDVKMIESIAEHIGIACENSRLYAGASNAAEKLAAERSQLFTILSGLEAHVYVADMETYDIIAVNRKMEEVYGSDLVGRKCYETLQNGQEGPCTFCTNERLLRHGRPTGPVVWKFKNTMTGRWYRCIDSAVLWPNGKYVRLEAAFDVTDAEEARIEAESAKSLLELYNDLMLHDLGNFASTSQGYLQIALESSTLGEDDRKTIASAHGQVVRCHELINKISQFSQVMTVTDDSRTAVDLDSLLNETIRDVEEMHPGALPEIVKRFEPAGRKISVGAFAKDIFLNILVNAVKYGKGETVELTVEEVKIGTVPAWKVSVLDRGPGIPPKMKELLFKRYSRLDGAKGTKGMGLGLSLAKTITNRYGGELRAEDRVPGDHSQGACFSVTLPRA